MPDSAAAKQSELTPQQSGMLSALDFWMYAAEALYKAATNKNDPKMQAASKAQEELQKIETQIERRPSIFNGQASADGVRVHHPEIGFQL